MSDKLGLTDRFGNPISSEVGSETPAKEFPEDLSLPEVNFANHMIALMTTATSYCGIKTHPDQPEPKKHKGLAQYHIDTIAMLYEKSKPNLDAAEIKFVEGVLFELRNIFVKSFSKTKGSSS